MRENITTTRQTSPVVAPITEETITISTHLETTDTSSDETTRASVSLQALAETLQSQNSTPGLNQIYDWLRNAQISEAELQPYLGFKEGNYKRHRVCRNAFVEMLVLCWRPGQRTPIHDHNGSHGGVRICRGMLWETIFSFDSVTGLKYEMAREHAPGAVTGSDVPDIHQLGNPDVSGQDLVTLHVYAPPLGVLHTYKPGSSKIDLYVPEDIDA